MGDGLLCSIFAKLPIRITYELRFCPNAASPGLVLQRREGSVDDITRRQRNEVGGDGNGLDITMVRRDGGKMPSANLIVRVSYDVLAYNFPVVGGAILEWRHAYRGHQHR